MFPEDQQLAMSPFTPDQMARSALKKSYEDEAVLAPEERERLVAGLRKLTLMAEAPIVRALVDAKINPRMIPIFEELLVEIASPDFTLPGVMPENVEQHTMLLKRSIEENIKMCQGSADPEEGGRAFSPETIESLRARIAELTAVPVAT